MTQLEQPPSREFPGREMFINDLGLHCEMSEDGTRMEGLATVGEHLRAPGSSFVRPAVLATIADVLAGIPACRATVPRLALTLDIVVHTVGAPTGDRLRAEARVLKAGRSTVATEVEFFDAATDGSTDGPASGVGALVAHSYLTFMPSPRPQDLAPPRLGGMHTTGSLTAQLADHVGARVVAPGVAEIDHRPFVVQASGALQGGIVALLGELAAESLTGGTVIDLDARYLTTVRVGPGRATAVSLGGGLIRVEVRDVGSDDRLAALVVARMRGARPDPAGAASGER